MLSLLALVACKTGDVTFYDGFAVNEEALGTDSLEDSPLGPYLAGSTIHVFARPPHRMRGNNSLEIFSTDSAVLDIVSQTVEDDYVVAEIDVVAEGEARIELWKHDWNLGGTAVSVHGVASGKVLWAPGVLAGRDEVATFGGSQRGLVAGGTAMFQIAYEDDDGATVLGSGLGVALPGENVSAFVTTEYQGRDGDWVAVSAFGGSLASVEFRVGPYPAGTITFSVLDDPSSTTLALYTPHEDDAFPGQTLFAAALAFGPNTVPFYGAPVSWEVDGEASGTSGEVFPYMYDPAADTHSLAISLGGLVDERDVKMGDPSKNVVGCALLPQMGLPRTGGLLGILVAMVAVCRRPGVSQPRGRSPRSGPRRR